MRRKYHAITAVICLTAVAVTAGCGKSSQLKTPGVYPVRGAVFVNGQPAEYANVILIPTDPNSKTRRAYGVVEADGVFQVSTEKEFDGAEPGEFFVTVSWLIPKNPKLSESEVGPEQLPPKYQDPVKSGLKVTVERKYNQLEPFELKI